MFQINLPPPSTSMMMELKDYSEMLVYFYQQSTTITITIIVVGTSNLTLCHTVSKTPGHVSRLCIVM